MHFQQYSYSPGLFPLLELTGRLWAEDGNHIYTYLCRHASKTPFHEFMYKMSPNITFMGCPQHPKMTNICYKHAVFGHIKKLEGDRQKFVE